MIATPASAATLLERLWSVRGAFAIARVRWLYATLVMLRACAAAMRAARFLTRRRRSVWHGMKWMITVVVVTALGLALLREQARFGVFFRLVVMRLGGGGCGRSAWLAARFAVLVHMMRLMYLLGGLGALVRALVDKMRVFSASGRGRARLGPARFGTVHHALVWRRRSWRRQIGQVVVMQMEVWMRKLKQKVYSQIKVEFLSLTSFDFLAYFLWKYKENLDQQSWIWSLGKSAKKRFGTYLSE